jgi:hypothetical protein
MKFRRPLLPYVPHGDDIRLKDVEGIYIQEQGQKQEKEQENVSNGGSRRLGCMNIHR